MEKNSDSLANTEQAHSLWYAHAMEQLVEVVQQLSLARDLPSVMEIVRHAARGLTGADGATFVLRDNGKCFYVEEDAISPLWKGQRFPMSACISGWAMLNRDPAVIEDIYTDPRIPVEAYRKTFVKSLVMVPIRTRDPIGAIGNYWAAHHRPTAEQVRVLQVLADTTAVAMENVAAFERIDGYVKQLEGMMEGTLQAVANMVEHRDPYTSGHERRVGIIASDIARELAWPEERCKSMQLIGLVHDIGKIAIPAEILTKPTRLDKLEYEMVKGHAEKGYEILKDVAFPLPIAEIIRQHHERMDGSGYPRGLTGDEIFPEARILAVADVLESMATHRPYRPALGMEAAISEIETHRGVHFDEQAVDAMLVLIRQKEYRLPS